MAKKKFIRITSKVEGFRRAGFAHSRSATDWPAGVFTDKQLAQLEAEPNLVVQEVELEVEDAVQDGKPDATKPGPGKNGGKGNSK